MFESYKDIKVGDTVGFQDVYVHDQLKISGQGKVIGFGEYAHVMFVWVETKDGVKGVAYQYTKKM